MRPRVLGVVFGVYLSAQTACRLDPEDSGPAIRLLSMPSNVILVIFD